MTDTKGLPIAGLQDDPLWEYHVEQIIGFNQTMPPEIKAWFHGRIGELAALAQKHNIPYRQTAIGIALMTASVAMAEAEGDVQRSAIFESFITFANAANVVAVAMVRQMKGYKPRGPDA